MNKKIIIFALIISLIFFAGCSSQINREQPHQEETKPEEVKQVDKNIPPEVKKEELTKEEKEKWMRYFANIDAVGLPQFSEDEEINDKILISYSLYHILKNENDYPVERGKYQKLGEYPYEIPKIKPVEVDEASQELFGRKIKEHQTVGGPLDFSEGYYWILPHGLEETFASPKIVSYTDNGDILVFIVEYYYNNLHEEGYVLDDGSKISDAEFTRRLLDEQASLKKEGQPFKVMQIKLKKNGEYYSILENINLTPKESSEIFPGEKQGYMSLERRSYLYQTTNWNDYNSVNGLLTFTIDFPENWVVSHTVFTDEKGSKKAEILPPVLLTEGQQLLDNWTPYPEFELISRENIVIDNHNGQKIVVKAFFDGQENYWYLHYYYLQINDKVLGIAFLEKNEQVDIELHQEMLKTLKLK